MFTIVLVILTLFWFFSKGDDENSGFSGDAGREKVETYSS
jgi:hypothetical protein